MKNKNIDKELFENIWFFCKNCYTIPFLKINLNSKKPEIFFKCKCKKIKQQVLNKDFLNNLKNSLINNNNDNICFFEQKKIENCFYCVNCKLNLCEKCLEKHNKFLDNKHYISKNKINLNSLCYVHNLINKNYCLDCQKYCCKKCILKIHFKHKIVNINEKKEFIKYNYSLNLLKENYEKNIEINNKVKNNFFQIVDDEIKNLINLKKKIENISKEINEYNYNIFEFLQIIYNNFVKSKDIFYNYNLLYNIENNFLFKNNNINSIPKQNLSNCTINELFEDCFNYLNKHYFIEQKKDIMLNKMKNIKIKEEILNLINMKSIFIIKTKNKFKSFDINFKLIDEISISQNDNPENVFICKISDERFVIVKDNSLKVYSLNKNRIKFEYDFENKKHKKIFISKGLNYNVITLDENKKMKVYDCKEFKILNEFSCSKNISKVLQIINNNFFFLIDNELYNYFFEDNYNNYFFLSFYEIPIGNLFVKHDKNITLFKKISSLKFISCSEDLIVISIYNNYENKFYKLKKENYGINIIDANYFIENILCLYYENNEIKLFDETDSLNNIYIIKNQETIFSILVYFDNDIFISFYKNNLSFWLFLNYKDLNLKRINNIYLNDNII